MDREARIQGVSEALGVVPQRQARLDERPDVPIDRPPADLAMRGLRLPDAATLAAHHHRQM
jgi:hypothetical protein